MKRDLIHGRRPLTLQLRQKRCNNISYHRVKMEATMSHQESHAGADCRFRFFFFWFFRFSFRKRCRNFHQDHRHIERKKTAKRNFLSFFFIISVKREAKFPEIESEMRKWCACWCENDDPPQFRFHEPSFCPITLLSRVY